MIRTNHLSTLFKHLFPIVYDEYIALKAIRSKETIAISAMQSEQRIKNEKADIAQDDQKSEEWREYCDDVYYGRRKQSVFAPSPQVVTSKPPVEVKRLPQPSQINKPVAAISSTCGLAGCDELTPRSNKKFCCKAHQNKYNYQRRK